LGKKCGRRERESRREGAEGAIPRRRKKLLKKAPSRVVAAEGILVFGKAALFAGRRWNEGLGRLVSVSPVSSAGIERAGDSGCPKERQGGERRRPTLTMRRNRTQARDTVACVSGRVLHSVLRPVLVNPHYAPGVKPGWWGTLEDIAAGQTRVTGRNQHRDRRGGRSATRHASLLSNERRDAHKKRKVVEAIVPARSWSPGLVARTS
jgi:hypothetical protein